MRPSVLMDLSHLNPQTLTGPGVGAGNLHITHPHSPSHTPDTHTGTPTDPLFTHFPHTHPHAFTHSHTHTQSMHATHLVLNLWCTNAWPHSLS